MLESQWLLNGRRKAVLRWVALVALGWLILGTPDFAWAQRWQQPWPLRIIDQSSRGADGVKLGDINGDGRPDVATGWEEGGVTRIYLHPGPQQVREPWPAVTVGRTPDVEDAVFADLDTDGRLDVVSCCEGHTRRIFVHWGPKKSRLLDPKAWVQEVLPASGSLGQMWMFAWPMQLDGQGPVDLVAGSKGRGAQLGWFQAPPQPRELNQWRWFPITQVGWIMSIYPVDMDGDGDLDLAISDRFGPLRGCRWLENPGPGPKLFHPWKNHFIGAQDHEVLSMTLADLDQDGLQDVVVAVKDMKLLFLRRLDRQGRRWQTHVIEANFGNGNPRAVAVADVNLDGQPDLVFTTWHAQGKHGVMWLQYDRAPTQTHWQPFPISGTEKGIKYDRIEMVDLDGDGDLDLLTTEERQGRNGLGVLWYENPCR